MDFAFSLTLPRPGHPVLGHQRESPTSTSSDLRLHFLASRVFAQEVVRVPHGIGHAVANLAMLRQAALSLLKRTETQRWHPNPTNEGRLG
jgi:hypothetical protein